MTKKTTLASRLRQLHAMLGSNNAQERETARVKIDELLAKHRKSWNDLTELMSVRISNFGGVLRELAPGAGLEKNDLRLILCETESRAAYLGYVIKSVLRQKWKVRGIELASTSKVACNYGVKNDSGASSQKIYVEADGELVGTLPAEISIVPDALTLLAP